MSGERRADLLAEIDTTLDGSGVYEGPWIDTGGVYDVRVCADTAAPLYLEESQDGSTKVPGIGALSSLRSEVGLTNRFFRVAVRGSSANAGQTFVCTVRALPIGQG